MSRIKSISLLAGAAVGIATMASAQTSQDVGRALSAEIAAQNRTMESSLQASNGPTPFGFTKFRANYNTRDSVGSATSSGTGGATVPGAEDTTQGFSNAETRIGFRGDVGDFNYEVSGSFGTNGRFALVDAFATHSYDNGWSASAGQFKDPFRREDLVSDTGLLSMDRSVASTAMNLGGIRVQGISATYQEDAWRATVSINDGSGSANTDFTSTGEADFGITARFEYMIEGSDFGVFDDFASFRGSDMTYMFGVAGRYQTGGESAAVGGFGGATADTDVTGVTGDFTIEGNGWNAFASITYVTTDPNVGTEVDDLSWMVQGGYFFDDSWEGFARYAATVPDDAVAGREDFAALTAGVNYYFIPESQAAKFTFAVDFFLDEQSMGVVPANTENNLLSSVDDSQFGIRGQLQLVF